MIPMEWLYAVAAVTVSLVLLTLAFMAHDINKEDNDGL